MGGLSPPGLSEVAHDWTMVTLCGISPQRVHLKRGPQKMASDSSILPMGMTDFIGTREDNDVFKTIGDYWHPVSIITAVSLLWQLRKWKKWGYKSNNTASINTLRLGRNGSHFPDILQMHFPFNENGWISITISLKFGPKGLINNIPAMVQIMAWCRSGDKPLSESMMVSLLTHITLPQWVNTWPNAVQTTFFQFIFMYVNCALISIKFVSKGPITKKSAIVQIMAWCRTRPSPQHSPQLTIKLYHVFFYCQHDENNGFPGTHQENAAMFQWTYGCYCIFTIFLFHNCMFHWKHSLLGSVHV